MARMHSRARGKSGSKNPTEKKVQTWMNYKPKEVEKLILKLAKTGKTTSEIGLYLRDSYGIPSVKAVAKKTILQILTENKIIKKIPEDLMNLIKKNIYLRKHLEMNHKDMAAKRGLELTDSKIRRLMKYYKKKKKLSEDWKFHPEQIKLYEE
ncbi:30S ribosomal protein S15 [Nanoarchaeota archaeon]